MRLLYVLVGILGAQNVLAGITVGPGVFSSEDESQIQAGIMGKFTYTYNDASDYNLICLTEVQYRGGRTTDGDPPPSCFDVEDSMGLFSVADANALQLNGIRFPFSYSVNTAAVNALYANWVDDRGFTYTHPNDVPLYHIALNGYTTTSGSCNGTGIVNTFKEVIAPFAANVLSCSQITPTANSSAFLDSAATGTIAYYNPS